MGASLVRSLSFSEDLRVQLDDGIEAWALKVVCVDTKEIFGY
jgi:hypothetical protein